MISTSLRLPFAPALVVLSALMNPGIARAAVVAGSTVSFPLNVAVGQSGLPAFIELRNNNTTPNQADSNVVCNSGAGGSCGSDPGITLIPSCGQLAFAGNGCTAADSGVFQLPATAVGQAGTACAGTVFNITLIDPTFGTVRFTPQPAGSNVVLPGAGTLCRIPLTVNVLKSPAFDLNPGAPGIQTGQILSHTQVSIPTSIASFSRTTGSSTVARATPTIATTASAGITLGAGQLTDTATVSGRINPNPGAVIDFRLYGPGDSTCSAAPVFSSLNVPYPVAGGGVTSATFTPTAVGIHRWRASYSGDANNLPVTGACNAANENVTVSLPALIFANGFE